MQVTLIPGFGIGPEITESVKRVFKAARAGIEWDEVDIRAMGSLDQDGKPWRAIQSLECTQVALKGPTESHPCSEMSVTADLRKAFGLFATARRFESICGLVDDRKKIDLFIIKEIPQYLNAGLEYLKNDDTAQVIKVISSSSVAKLGRFAFGVGRHQKRRDFSIVHGVDKTKVVDAVFINELQRMMEWFPEIRCQEVATDTFCMRLVADPSDFDMILSECLYGDIILGIASSLIGGSVLSAGFSASDKIAIYEPLHGPALHLEGKNVANPTGMLLSGAMLLEHLGFFSKAIAIKSAIHKIVRTKAGRTSDLGGTLSTTEFTDLVIENLLDNPTE